MAVLGLGPTAKDIVVDCRPVSDGALMLTINVFPMGR